MNSEFDDRLLEIALEESLGRLRRPDVVAGVRLALAARKLRRRALAAAACLLVAAGVTALALRSDDEPDTVAMRFAAPVAVMDAQGTLHHRREVRSGDRVVAGAGGLDVAVGEGRADIAEGSIVQWGRAGPASLLWGAMTVGESAAGEMGSPVGAIRWDAGSEVELTLLPWAPRDEGAPLRVARGATVAHRLRARVRSGTARATAPAGEVTAHAGHALRLYADGRVRVDSVPSAQELAHFASWFASADVAAASLDLTTLRGRDRLAAAVESGRVLQTSIGEHPGLADHLRGRILRRLQQPIEQDVARRFLDALIDDDDPRTHAAFSAALDVGGDDLSSAALLALAERGIARAAARLRARVVDGDPGASELILPAAYFALRRDDVGRARLQRAFEQEAFGAANPERCAIVATALFHLGATDAWAHYTSELAAWVARRLEAGDLSAARAVVRAGLYAMRDEAPPPLHALRARIIAFEKETAAPLATAEDLRRGVGMLQGRNR